MSVMIGTPIKNCAGWLRRFFYNLDRFTDVSRVVLSYGESIDATLRVAREWAAETRHKVEVYAEPAMPAMSAAEIAPVYQDFQRLMTKDETHFLLIDSDIAKAPKNLIQLLKKQKKDIVAPYVWIQGRTPKEFYDCEVFRLDGYRFHPFRPPHSEKPFQLDSVGSCYLATREVFLTAQFGNPHPHRVFCNDARERGYEVWADPRISIYHLDLPRLGILHRPIEALRGMPRDRSPFIDSMGKTFSFEEMKQDYSRAYLWGKP